MSEERKICGAKTRSGHPCKKPPMKGKKRCANHGGKSTGPPKGSKNALKTGEYETIIRDALTDEEKVIWDNAATNHVEDLKTQARVLTIRMVRMMRRLRELKESEEETLLESKEFGYTEKLGKTSMTRLEHKDNRIIKLEEALTRVQAQHTRVLNALEEIHRREQDKQQMGHLDDLLRVIEESRNAIQREQMKDTEEDDGV